MKAFLYTLLFLFAGFFVQGQNYDGTPVEGVTLIKRVATTEANSTSKTAKTPTKTASTTTSTTAKMLTTAPAPTGSSQEVGSTEGQLSVSLTGGANYTIPIAVPPGINGVVPQVSLVYNSQGGNGTAGYGWNISGVSMITRIPRTKYHDGVVGGVNFDANDCFAFDGQRLILKSGTYGANGAVYETENFSNVKITSLGVSTFGANFGPASFLVEYPDGSKAEYGSSNNSRSITTWGITYWQNPQGVRILYNYANADNLLNIQSIQYGSTGANPPINQIQFVYKTRQRTEQSYIAGQNILMNTILSEIKITTNGVGFRNYVLAHGVNSLYYERLISITEKNGDGSKSYNPTVFGYEDTFGEGLLTQSPVVPEFNLSNINAESAGSEVGDFDGDGKNDFIIYPKTGVDAFKKYWVYQNVQGSAYNYDIQHNVGEFKNIFATSFLYGDATNGYIVAPKQGYTVVKNNNDINYTFDVYATTLTGLGMQYSKSVVFPIVNLTNFCVGCANQSTTNKIFPKKILSADFNGDGLTDIVAIDTSLEYVSCSGLCLKTNRTVNSQKVYFIDLKKGTPISSTSIGSIIEIAKKDTNIQVIDFNSDGKSDFMVLTEGKVTVYTLGVSNNLVVLASLSDTAIKADMPCLLGDYNGDGKTDFIIPQANGEDKWCHFINSGVNFIKYTSQIGIIYRKNYSTETDFNGTWKTKEVKIFEHIYTANDSNGDGKTDIISTYNETFDHINKYRTSYGKETFDGADYTDQGRPIETYISIQNNVYVLNESRIYTTVGRSLTGVRTYPIMLFTNHTQPNLNLEFSLLTGNKIYTYISNFDNRKENSLATITTGNGVIETINYKPLVQEQYSYPLGNYYPFLYQSNYPNTDIAVAPDFQVVSMLEKQSSNVYKKQLFSYAGAVSNTEGLGFLGFRSLMRTNWFETDAQSISNISKHNPSLRGAQTESYTYQGIVSPQIVSLAVPNTPRQSSIVINNARSTTETVIATTSVKFLPGANIKPLAGNTFTAKVTPDYDANSFEQTNTIPPSNLITKSLTFYEASISASKVYKLQNIQTNNYNLLDNTSTETTMVYDAYNNPTESVSKVRNAGASQQTTTTAIAYATPLTASRPVSKTQTVLAYGDSFTTKENYTYGAGTEANLLKKIEKQGNNTSVLTETNTYDTFGNIIDKTIAAPGSTNRKTAYKYDTSGRFLIESTDIEGLKTTYVYNPSGTLLSETNPYNLTTTYLYDTWFKKIKTTDYLGKSNTYAYTRVDTKNTKISTTGDDGSFSEELLDDLGRKIRVGIKDIQGSMAYTDTSYDIYDRAINVSEPHRGSPIQWNTTTFDIYGRPTSSLAFTGKQTTITYSKLSTTINDGTTTKTVEKNAMGNVVKQTETIGGTILYSYFANGNLKSTNYAGATTTITQDGWGRKTSLTDPSAGTYTYAYNDFGETTKETTPNGTTSYTLDAFGKLTTKTIVGTNTNSSTQYTYDATSKLLNSLVFTNTLAGNSSTTTYSYDAYQRLVSTTEETPYAKFSKNINEFDAYGRVTKETSKAEILGKTSSTTLLSTYQNGYAYQMLNDADKKVLWQTNTVNARGQLLTATMGNGTAISNTYDAYGYVQQYKHDIASTSTNIMTLNTVFDTQKGNLNSRTNSLFATSDTFTYDSLDRLTSYPNAQGIIVSQSYEDDGRIKANNLGSYTYGSATKKYQNTSIALTPEAKSYYETKPLQNISYNAFKAPVEISEKDNDKISFEYNDDNSRTAMFYGSLDANKTLRPLRKYYSADGTMEIKVNTNTQAVEFITYLGGDGYTAPVVYKQNHSTATPLGVGGLLYLHRDYQGSILAITDAYAVVLEKRLFDAWGTLINYYNATGAPFGGWGAFDRGYTGHEHLQSVGLINMNGRLYDPKLHRFLQPDNYVQDPSNTQNYNRYGYVLNNPLAYTDLSGELCDCPNQPPVFTPEQQNNNARVIKSFFESKWFSNNFSARNFDAVGTFLGRNVRSAAEDVGRFLGGLFGGSKPSAPVMNVRSNAVSSTKNATYFSDGSAFFKNEFEAYNYMVKKSNMGKKNATENFGYITKNGVAVLPNSGFDMWGNKFDNYWGHSEPNVMGYMWMGYGKNFTVNFHGKVIRPIAYIHTHPDFFGGYGQSAGDTSTTRTFGIPSVVIGRYAIWYQTLKMAKQDQGGYEIMSLHELLSGEIPLIYNILNLK